MGGQEGLHLHTSTINCWIHHNVVYNIGWAGFLIYGKNHLIEYNYITKAMATLADGGGIYMWQTWTSFITLRYNVVSSNLREIWRHFWRPLFCSY